jgi:ADP-L-glycero-D-manno-heptose 6-epimerase
MIIVTGGAGFIGSAFVRKLNELGETDILIVDDLGKTEKWKNLLAKTYTDYLHKTEFLRLVTAGKLKGRVEAIVHMGACSSTTETDADYLMENNTRYTRVLCEWAMKRKARFIYASSAATYGDGSNGYSDADADTPGLRPLNGYGWSKHAFDLVALRRGWLKKVAGLKFFNVYGPNEYHKGDMMSVICKARRQILETGRVRLFRSHRPDFGDGEQKRDFIYVKDCVEVMAWLLKNPKVNGLYNLGSGTSRTWKDLVHAVFAAMEREPSIEYIDMPEAIRDKYQYFTEARMEKLRKAGFRTAFHTLEEGVHDYVTRHFSSPDPYF